MDIFKRASRLALRVETSRGALSVEKLWSLTLTELDSLAVELQDKVENSAKKSFLTIKSDEDSLAKLKFDVVLDILSTKLKAQESAAKAAETKAHNKQIDELVARKQEQELANLSIAELEKLRK